MSEYRIVHKTLNYVKETKASFERAKKTHRRMIRGKEYIMDSGHTLTNLKKIKHHHEVNIERLQQMGHNVRISVYTDKNEHCTFLIWRSVKNYND